MQLLTFTTLYPNALRPTHGIFVETRLRHLVESGQVESRVLAPVPWFPVQSPRFGGYAEYARVPRSETRHGIVVDHPRYVAIPKVGMQLAPRLLAWVAARHARRMRAAGYRFGAIDAHYFYPDGVAAAEVGQQLGVPVVITARGSDVNLIGQFPGPRRRILWAAERAAMVIAVSRALRDRLVELGVGAEKIRVLRNGVNLERFHPVDPHVARATLGLEGGPWLALVGNLVPEKGHDLALRAAILVDRARVVIVGRGSQEQRLRALATQLGIADRVRFLAPMPQEALARVYSAADALVLASRREGWPNVLLEAMACGTPVVATDVGGCGEIVAAPEAGVVVRERTPDALAQGIRQLLACPPERAATRAYASRFGWGETTRGQLDIFSSLQ